MSRKTYPLPKSGKTATRMDYKTGLTEIAVPGGRGVVRRYGPTLAWIVVARGAEIMRTLTLSTAMAALDRAETD